MDSVNNIVSIYGHFSCRGLSHCVFHTYDKRTSLARVSMANYGTSIPATPNEVMVLPQLEQTCQRPGLNAIFALRPIYNPCHIIVTQSRALDLQQVGHTRSKYLQIFSCVHLLRI